jgi:hypothetical protein
LIRLLMEELSRVIDCGGRMDCMLLAVFRMECLECPRRVSVLEKISGSSAIHICPKMKRSRSYDGPREAVNGRKECRVPEYSDTWEATPLSRRGLLRELIRVTVCKIVAETKSIKTFSWLNGKKGPFTYSSELRLRKTCVSRRPTCPGHEDWDESKCVAAWYKVYCNYSLSLILLILELGPASSERDCAIITSKTIPTHIPRPERLCSSS